MNTVTYHQACLERGVDLGRVEATLAAIGTAGARPFRPERWNAYSEGAGGYQYQVASGDTLSGLAALYLDDPSRWPEIWNMQGAARTQYGSPDQIFADEWLDMPIEAGENARSWNGGELPGTAGKAGSKGLGGGEEPPAAKAKTAAVVVGVGAAALLVIYLATR
jgi:hypothetical protein